MVEAKGIIPQGIDLHEVALAAYDGLPVDLGIHPGEGLAISQDVAEPCLVDAEIGVHIAQIVVDQLVEEVPVASDHIGGARPGGILLQRPHRPQAYIGFVDAAYLLGDADLVHEVAQLGDRRIHDPIVALGRVGIDRAAGEGDEEVTGTHPEPRVARQQIAMGRVGAVVEL